MGCSVRLVSMVFLLLQVVATEMGPKVAEARTCKSASQEFKGPCVSDSNCANVCRTEGFQRGHCRGVRSRCICTKDCQV